MLLVGSQQSEQPKHVNFELYIREFRIDIFWTKCKIRFIYVRFNCKRKKMGKRMDGKKCHFRGWDGLTPNGRSHGKFP